MHTLSFIGLLLTALFAPGWVFLCLAVVYLWFYTGYEVFGITILIDVYFGTGGFITGAWYTTVFALVFICMMVLKPNLRFSA